jgi:hypothetical protein
VQPNLDLAKPAQPWGPRKRGRVFMHNSSPNESVIIFVYTPEEQIIMFETAVQEKRMTKRHADNVPALRARDPVRLAKRISNTRYNESVR